MPGGGKGGGSTSSTVNVNNGPITVDADSTSTVQVQGLDKIGVTAHIDPLRLDSRQELAITEPIRTESKADITTKSDINTKSDVNSNSDSKSALSVDLKPVVLDVCTTNNTTLPKGEICQPFNFHFGLTWMGMEMLGFNFGGESRMIFQDLPKKPSIEWPAQQNAPAAPSPPCRDDSGAHERGLRIRIK